MVKFGHVKTNLNMVSLKPNVQHINKDICLLRFMVSLHSGSNGTKMLQNAAHTLDSWDFWLILIIFLCQIGPSFCIFLIQNYLLWFELFKTLHIISITFWNFSPHKLEWNFQKLLEETETVSRVYLSWVREKKSHFNDDTIEIVCNIK